MQQSSLESNFIWSNPLTNTVARLITIPNPTSIMVYGILVFDSKKEATNIVPKKTRIK
jgi:hypothetical protein